VILLIGELALLHDIGGLLAAGRAGAELTIVCANNGGGGIFDFLPVAGAADPALYEEHIVTPSGVDLERVAALAHMPLIEVRTDRAENVAQHRALFARVAEQLG
jgi:2-succinyl-5-enolpyruvyl-6-hydroxy-3-cyclohexene-1-carboxylate synthase